VDGLNGLARCMADSNKEPLQIIGRLESLGAEQSVFCHHGSCMYLWIMTRLAGRKLCCIESTEMGDGTVPSVTRTAEEHIRQGLKSLDLYERKRMCQSP
jgi:hypothetical protein